MRYNIAMKIKRLDQLIPFTTESKWLVQDLLMQQGLTILAAAPKSTKSFFCLELCVSLVTNKNALNHYKTAEACRVLYFAAEDSESIVHERLTGLLKAKGLTNIDNLGVLTSPAGLRLDTDEGYASLVEQIELFKPKLIVIDCLYAIHRTSENDSGSILAVLEKLKQIRDEFKTAVLLVHHTSKGADSKRVGARLRGSSAIWGFFESLLALRKDDSGDIYLDVEHRAASSFQTVPIEMKVDESGITYAVKSVSPAGEISETRHQSVEDQIVASVQYHIPISVDDLALRTNFSIPTLRQILYRLLKAKRLTWTRQGYLRGDFQ